MSTIWDYVNAINMSKEDLMTDDQQEREYTPFVVNRSLSYFADTVLPANEMNITKVDNKLAFHYLINTVRPRKRFSKWAKKTEDNDLLLVMEYYGYNNRKAEDALRILTPDQIEQVKQRLQKGRSE